MRQQLQAKAAFLVGIRETDTDFLTSPPTDVQCQECHSRPNDRHPIYRFLEPRFAEARAAIHPESCMSCHSEHTGERFNTREIGADYCKNCHAETEVNDDPLDISHTELIKAGRWSTCLQCHDFHGSHTYDLPTSMKDTLSLLSVRSYLLDGDTIYGRKSIKAPFELFTKKKP